MMNMRHVLIAALLSTVLVVLGSVYATEPKNLDLLKQQYLSYYDSGEYAKDQAKVVAQAMDYLKLRLTNAKKENSPEKLAIVLDIDETSLSNYPSMKTLRFGGTYEQIEQAVKEGKDPAIDPTLKLYRYAEENHIAVFFITGRLENSRDSTERNLKNAGYEQWTGLVMKPENYHEKSASFYKIQARADIEKQGYRIVLNMGDQKSDLIGGHADKTFKLPNPYYFIP